MSDIRVYVNSKPQILQEQAKINDLLAALNISSDKGIALAVNNNVIPKTEWHTYELMPEARITVIKATQGG